MQDAHLALTPALRVLIVEDHPDEADLMVLHLREAGMRLEWRLVATEGDYLAELDPPPDVILCDWRLPRFSGLRALQLLRERRLDIPFVIVSGSIGEEAAIDALRLGAYDYVLKDRPARLAPAVRHALDDKRFRQQQQAAQEALRESENRYRTLFQDMPVGLYRSGVDGRILAANPALAALLGFESPEELLGLDASRLYAEPEDAARWRRAVEQRGELVDAEIRLRRRDGRPIWARDTGRAVYDEAGRLLYYQGALSNITERKQAEEALRQSEARYRDLVDHTHDVICTHDLEGRLLSVNPRGLELTGFSAGELLQRNLRDFLPPEHGPLVDAYLESVRTHGAASGRLTLLTRSGERRILEYHNTLRTEGTPQPIVRGYAHDVTVQVRAEKEIQRRIRVTEGLYLTSMQLLARRDLDGMLLDIIERVTALTGSVGGCIFLPTPDGQGLTLRVSHNLRPSYVGTVLALGEGLTGRAALERRILAIEDYRSWEGRSDKFQVLDLGRAMAVPMVVEDRLVGVLYVSGPGPGAYAEEDTALASLFANQAALAIELARLLEDTQMHAAYLEGLTAMAETLRAATDVEAVCASVLQPVLQQLRGEGACLRLLDSQRDGSPLDLTAGTWGTADEPCGPAEEQVAHFLRTSGTPFVTEDVSRDPRLSSIPAQVGPRALVAVSLSSEEQDLGYLMVRRISPFRPEEARLLTGMAEIAANAIERARVMDTLEERVRQRTQELERANAQLLELDRLKTDFVSTVTHELRTPITNILLYLDLARRTDSEVKRARYFDVLKSESARLGRLIEEVLTLSRLDRGVTPSEREPHPIDALLAEVCTAHQARAEAKGVRLDHEPDPTLPAVPIEQTQIHQVLTNLVGNAVAYTPPGGCVRLSTARTQVGDRHFVGAAVHNTGTYIPPEEMQHLFQRFYRGAVGRASGESGTGLGLAISKQIVELHHGWIEVESSPEDGTTFTAWLPLAGSEIPSAP